jgi:hypothetical protein
MAGQGFIMTNPPRIGNCTSGESAAGRQSSAVSFWLLAFELTTIY